MSRQLFFFRPQRLLAAIAALTLIASSGALAQTSAHPDLIRLSDGDFFRGTIVEFVKDEYAIIETPSGALRRVEASDALYIGPAKDEPAATAESGVEDPAFVEISLTELPEADAFDASPDAEDELYDDGLMRVRILSREEGLTLHETRLTGVVAGSNISGTIHAWAPLCTAPCETWMAPGYHHRMLIENARRQRALVRAPVYLAEPADLELSVQSKRVARIVLLSLGIPLTAVGLGLMTGSALSGVGSRCTYDGDCGGMNWSMFIGGTVAFGVGMGLMLSGFSVRDRGKISVHPYGSLDQEGPDEPANATH